MSNKWNDFQSSIEYEFRNNKKSFLRQPTIKKTMAVVSKGLADSIAVRLNNYQWPNESEVGSPLKISNGFTLSTCQAVWYNYLIQKHLNKTFNSITEIGGGYGNGCRVFKYYNPNIDYTIIDFPIMNEMQKYFLKENGITDTRFSPKGDMKGDLLFATHSICEIPIEEREFIKWENFNNAFVFYNPHAMNYDNDDYFNEVAKKYNGKIFNDEIRKNKKYLII